MSQKPFLKGFCSLSEIITFFTLKFSIETDAALEGGSIISPSCIVLFPKCACVLKRLKIKMYY